MEPKTSSARFLALGIAAWIVVTIVIVLVVLWFVPNRIGNEHQTQEGPRWQQLLHWHFRPTKPAKKEYSSPSFSVRDERWRVTWKCTRIGTKSEFFLDARALRSENQGPKSYGIYCDMDSDAGIDDIQPLHRYPLEYIPPGTYTLKARITDIEEWDVIVEEYTTRTW